MSEDQYKQLNSWLNDLDHTIRGNGRPGLVERTSIMEKEVLEIKDTLKTRADRQWYLTLTVAAAVLVDIASHWATQHIK